jgi:hypothetical protein
MAEITRQVGISAVNSAVISRLKTDANTIAYVAKIFNNVVKDTAMPYIHVTGYICRPSAMFGSRDFAPEDVSFEVHVWHGSLGDKDCATIMNLVSKALTNSALSITGYTNLYKCEMGYCNILIDTTEPATPVRHGVLRFMLRICPN